jgi:hypothetical protein
VHVDDIEQQEYKESIVVVAISLSRVNPPLGLLGSNISTISHSTTSDIAHSFPPFFSGSSSGSRNSSSSQGVSSSP